MESVKHNIEQLISNWEIHEALDEMEGLAHSIEQRNKRNIAKKAVANCRKDIMAFENATIESFDLGTGYNPLRQEHINRMHNLLTWILNTPSIEKQRPAPVRSSPRPKPDSAKIRHSTKVNVPKFEPSIEIPGSIDEKGPIGSKNKGSGRCFWLKLSFGISMALGVYSVALPYWAGYGILPGMWSVIAGFLGVFIPFLTIVEQLTRKTQICTNTILLFFMALTGSTIAASVATTVTWIDSVVVEGEIEHDGVALADAEVMLSAISAEQSRIIACKATTTEDGEFMLYYAKSSLPADADSLLPEVALATDETLKISRMNITEGSSTFYTACKLSVVPATDTHINLFVTDQAAEQCCNCSISDVKGRMYVMPSDREICNANFAAYDSVVVYTADTVYSLLTDSEGYFSFPFISDWQRQIKLDVFHGPVRDRCCFTASLPGYMGVCEADSIQDVSLIIRAIPVLLSGREGANCPQYQLIR